MTVLGPKSLFSTKSTPLNLRECGNMFKTAAYRWQGRQAAAAVCLLFVAQCDCGSSDCLALSLLKTDKPTRTSGLHSQGSRSSTLTTSKRFVPPILTARSMPCRSRVPVQAACTDVPVPRVSSQASAPSMSNQLRMVQTVHVQESCVDVHRFLANALSANHSRSVGCGPCRC